MLCPLCHHIFYLVHCIYLAIIYLRSKRSSDKKIPISVKKVKRGAVVAREKMAIMISGRGNSSNSDSDDQGNFDFESDEDEEENDDEM